MAGARGFSAAGSEASSDAGQQQDSRNGGVEGYLFKGLLFATLLAIALKLGPHIGVPTGCLGMPSPLQWHHCHGRTGDATVQTSEPVHYPSTPARQADDSAVQQDAARLCSPHVQLPVKHLLATLMWDLCAT